MSTCCFTVHPQVSLRPGYLYLYRVSIQPSGCPRRINREIVKTMVDAYAHVTTTSSSSNTSSSTTSSTTTPTTTSSSSPQVWRTSSGPVLPVYDGRDSLYTSEPVASLGEDKERFQLEVHRHSHSRCTLYTTGRV